MAVDFPFLLDFTLYRNADFKQVVTQSMNNSPRDLTGFEYVFRARNNDDGTVQNFETSIVGSEGLVEFYLPREDVNEMSAGSWSYSVYQTDTSGFTMLFCMGTINVINTI